MCRFQGGGGTPPGGEPTIGGAVLKRPREWRTGGEGGEVRLEYGLQYGEVGGGGT